MRGWSIDADDRCRETVLIDHWYDGNQQPSIATTRDIISSSIADADAPPAADHSTAVVAASYRFEFYCYCCCCCYRFGTTPLISSLLSFPGDQSSISVYWSDSSVPLLILIDLLLLLLTDCCCRCCWCRWSRIMTNCWSIDRRINRRSAPISQFFTVSSPSKPKRIGVPPLLRTASATLCLWDCP